MAFFDLIYYISEYGGSMKTIALPSPGTRQPIMLNHGVMNHNKAKRYSRIGSWKHSKKLEIYFSKKQTFKNNLKQYRNWLMVNQSPPKR